MNCVIDLFSGCVSEGEDFVNKSFLDGQFYPLSRRCVLKFVMLPSNNVLEVNPVFPSPQKPTFPNFNSISVSTISSALVLLEA